MVFIVTWIIASISVLAFTAVLTCIVLLLDYIDEKLRSPYDFIVVISIVAVLLGLVFTALFLGGGKYITEYNVKGNADNCNIILNSKTRKDHARLLEVIADRREPDFEEVEQLANKYRFYYNENGTLMEVE